jgi:glycosyltransferase involved in cell wall biosynthesis
MVFPSLTDTFGLVLLESMACGTPVAAFPVTGPKDVLAAGGAAVGCVDKDLRHAALQALAHGDRAACRAYAQTYSWQACAERFIANLVPIKQGLEVVSFAGA